jgi:hypothetical protein
LALTGVDFPPLKAVMLGRLESLIDHMAQAVGDVDEHTRTRGAPASSGRGCAGSPSPSSTHGAAAMHNPTEIYPAFGVIPVPMSWCGMFRDLPDGRRAWTCGGCSHPSDCACEGRCHRARPRDYMKLLRVQYAPRTWGSCTARSARTAAYRDRARVFDEWVRLLAPGGRVLFTDPITVTGPLSSDEIAIRASIGYFVFVPPGEDERLLRKAALRPLGIEDATENMAAVAERWLAARAKRAGTLREIEGEQTFDGQQRFLEVAARLARERRLSRFVYLAEKPR